MGTVYSTNLVTIPPTVGPVDVAVGPPAGYLWVVREICVVNELPASQINTLVGVFVGTNLGAVILRLDAGTITWESHVNWSGRVIIGPTDGLQVATVDNYWAVTIDGYQLTLP
jgi:hypothetical protein